MNTKTLLISAALSVSLIGCGNNNDSWVVGDWNCYTQNQDGSYSTNIPWSFNKDGSWEMAQGGVALGGSYEISDEKTINATVTHQSLNGGSPTDLHRTMSLSYRPTKMSDGGLIFTTALDSGSSRYFQCKRAEKSASSASLEQSKSGTSISQPAHGPMLQAGAVVCSDMRSMYKANAIARANNPYVSLPDDCTKAANPVPLRSAANYNGMVKIEIESNGQLVQAWTTANFVSNN